MRDDQDWAVSQHGRRSADFNMSRNMQEASAQSYPVEGEMKWFDLRGKCIQPFLLHNKVLLALNVTVEKRKKVLRAEYRKKNGR